MMLKKSTCGYCSEKELFHLLRASQAGVLILTEVFKTHS